MATEVTRPPAHSRRVQAWVYAILNPLIESLRRELYLLEKGALSWRWYSRRCEYIRPVSEYIENSQLPNYEDFVSDTQNAGFKEGFENHDHQVSEVEASASRFFDGLMNSPVFLKQVNDSLQEYESSVSAKPLYPGLDSMRQDLPKYIAEYLINRTDVLPHHYTTHKFWEDYRNRFDLSANEFEPYRERQSFQSLRNATVALKNVSEKLRVALEKHRQLLCTTYDIPAAPIPVDRSHSADALIV